MTASELLVLLLAPGLVAVGLLTMGRRGTPLVCTLYSVAVLAAVALCAGWGGGSWVAATSLVGGALLAMVWVLRSPTLANRPVLQAVLALPVYLLALLVLVSVAVTLGLISP